MHGKYTRLMALMALLVIIIASSCGRTVYSKNYPNQRKFTHMKSNNHYWHKHQNRPHSRSGGGYW